MFIKRIAIASAIFALAVSPVLAQATQPAAPAAPVVPRPATAAPAAPAALVTAPRPATPAAAVPAAPAAPAAAVKPATPVAAPAPAAAAQTKKINLNTADAKELDDLPQIGPARAKAIIEARTKGGKFKDWADFTKRNVVPGNAEEAIKDKVAF